MKEYLTRIDDDFITPYRASFLLVYDKVIDVISKNFDKKTAHSITTRIKNELLHLISHSSYFEDVVLITSLLYSFKRQTGLDINFDGVSSLIIKNVEFLLKNEKENNFDSIFFSDKKYLKSILLNDYVFNFDPSNVLSVYKAQKIAKAYQDKVNSNLMKELLSLLNSKITKETK